MISFAALKAELQALDSAELGRWIEAELVRAEGRSGAWRFHEIDVARIRLILELRDGLEIEERSLPVVLSLMDQLYDTRRLLVRLNAALADLPEAIREEILLRLGTTG